MVDEPRVEKRPRESDGEEEELKRTKTQDEEFDELSLVEKFQQSIKNHSLLEVCVASFCIIFLQFTLKLRSQPVILMFTAVVWIDSIEAFLFQKASMIGFSAKV